MDELYRMLGREHEADLARDAAKWRQGAVVRSSRLGLRTGSDLLGPRSQKRSFLDGLLHPGRIRPANTKGIS
jgi:hypothetical protein